MKNKENDLIRLKNLLMKNKFGSDDKFDKLFYQDLCSVLSDYFTLSGEPLISIEKSQAGFSVSVSFNALELKRLKTVES